MSITHCYYNYPITYYDKNSSSEQAEAGLAPNYQSVPAVQVRPCSWLVAELSDITAPCPSTAASPIVHRPGCFSGTSQWKLEPG